MQSLLLHYMILYKMELIPSSKPKKSHTALFLVEKSDKLKNMIVGVLEQDILRSLRIDNQLEKNWFWWRRVDLVSEQNGEILRKVLEVLSSP